MNIILASASPRRKELLSTLVDKFSVQVSQADEHVSPQLSPTAAVVEIARRKGQAVFSQGHERDLVISADTIVVVNDKILGKPADTDDGARMLRLLSGRQHQVYTAVWVFTPQGEEHFLSGTTVEFLPMTEEEIQWYLSTGEPMDKAGAYGIQGLGSRFIREIQGDYFGVMGLPVSPLWQILKKYL